MNMSFQSKIKTIKISQIARRTTFNAETSFAHLKRKVDYLWDLNCFYESHHFAVETFIECCLALFHYVLFQALAYLNEKRSQILCKSKEARNEKAYYALELMQ